MALLTCSLETVLYFGTIMLLVRLLVRGDAIRPASPPPGPHPLDSAGSPGPGVDPKSKSSQGAPAKSQVQQRSPRHRISTSKIAYALMLSSFGKLFVLVMVVWDYDAVFGTAIEFFVMTSNITACKVLITHAPPTSRHSNITPRQHHTYHAPLTSYQTTDFTPRCCLAGSKACKPRCVWRLGLSASLLSPPSSPAPDLSCVHF
jgi:hypothetical protein